MQSIEKLNKLLSKLGYTPHKSGWQEYNDHNEVLFLKDFGNSVEVHLDFQYFFKEHKIFVWVYIYAVRRAVRKDESFLIAVSDDRGLAILVKRLKKINNLSENLSDVIGQIRRLKKSNK